MSGSVKASVSRGRAPSQADQGRVHAEAEVQDDGHAADRGRQQVVDERAEPVDQLLAERNPVFRRGRVVHEFAHARWCLVAAAPRSDREFRLTALSNTANNFCGAQAVTGCLGERGVSSGSSIVVEDARGTEDVDRRVAALLDRMSLEEKIGQMSLVNAGDSHVPDHLADGLREGRVGGVLNEVDAATVNELQRIAVEESRLGIPLLIGRDVIHGFRTVMPIPLGQAATWNPDLVMQAARVAAREAASCGVNWTFAPMIDVCRDPRWGRIAECLGEDPHLASVLGVAMLRGFQGPDLG